MKKQYFIMMNLNGGITPIVGDNEEVKIFDTLEDAKGVAEGHPPCQAFGYEIFERGRGIGAMDDNGPKCPDCNDGIKDNACYNCGWGVR
jgi:hypothetical protein